MKILKPRNYGVIIEKRASDFIAGAETGIKYEEVNKIGDWTAFLPTAERQRFNEQNENVFDSMSCVSFSALNCIETQIDFMVANNLIPADKLALLKQWGFFDANGKFNCSDRFTAKMSKTTINGNSGQNVWDSIRKDGLVPEAMWVPTGCKSWEDWNAEIPQQIKDFAKNILAVLDFKYEWVVLGNCGDPVLDWLKLQLKQAPLQILAPYCGKGGANGVCNPCNSCITQHATSIYAINDVIHQFDHYDPFYNKLALNYTMPYIIKGVVSVKVPAPTPVIVPIVHAFYQPIRYGERSNEVSFLQKALMKLGYKTFDTGYFGEWTRQAVLKFQFDNKVASYFELTSLQGKYVGVKTRAMLNKLLNK